MLLAAIDVGNGYMKSLFMDPATDTRFAVDIPSSAAYMTATDDLKVPADQASSVIEDIFNQADVSFDSVLVKDLGRRLLGQRGVDSGLALEEFDVYSHISKANQDLSGIMILGMCACKALQDYFNAYHSLPADTITEEIRLGVALPIREYKKFRKEFGDRLRDNTHYVTFHNFEQRVRIEIKFTDVQVLAEGACAQYAVYDKGEAFADSMLAECRKYEALDGITGADIIQAKTTIGIDIGEGTVNLPVFDAGAFNNDVSMTFDKGYGTILNNTNDRLQDMGMSFKSRKELSAYLHDVPNAIQRPVYAKVSKVRDEETVSFINEVKLQFIKILSRVGVRTEVVYVYGGGATELYGKLYPALMDAMKSFGVEIPVLYLDSRYSRFLNRDGLMYVVKHVYIASGGTVAKRLVTDNNADGVNA